MGGTTAKICLIDDGEPPMSPDFEVARARPLQARQRPPAAHRRSIDLIEIGAGGGSIAADRRARPAQGRPASAGRRSRPGLLRARRHRADRHRRRPAARLSQPRTPSSAARCGSTSTAPRAAVRRGSPTPLGLDASRTALGHPRGREREHGGRRRAVHVAEREPRPAALLAVRLRRRRPGARRRGRAQGRHPRGDRAARRRRDLGARAC